VELVDSGEDGSNGLIAFILGGEGGVAGYDAEGNGDLVGGDFDFGVAGYGNGAGCLRTGREEAEEQER
jgi:hypothetical protein